MIETRIIKEMGSFNFQHLKLSEKVQTLRLFGVQHTYYGWIRYKGVLLRLRSFFFPFFSFFFFTQFNDSSDSAFYGDFI